MTEKFINNLLDTLENMDGFKHIVLIFNFYLGYYAVLCTLHDVQGPGA